MQIFFYALTNLLMKLIIFAFNTLLRISLNIFQLGNCLFIINIDLLNYQIYILKIYP